jgi:hypothetical protein
VAARARSGGWLNTGVIGSEARDRAEAEGKVGQEGMDGVGCYNRWKGRGFKRAVRGHAFQRVGRVEDGRVVGSRAGCIIGCRKGIGYGDVLLDEGVVETPD